MNVVLITVGLLVRLWSIHPKYLDSKGLVALWREALLAKKVLEGKTRGYRQHPQLQRFKNTSDPVLMIQLYLYHVHGEAVKRNYSFDKTKIGLNQQFTGEYAIPVTSGQIMFEKKHLLEKLEVRDKTRHDQLVKITMFDTHPLFTIKEGDIESWEKTS